MKSRFNELSQFFLAPLFLSVADAGSGGAAGAGDSSGNAGVAGGAAADAGQAGAAAAVVAASATSGSSGPLIGPDGKFVAGWSKLLGGTDQLEQKFTDPKALVGSYLSLEKLISAKGIIPPGPNATAEEKSAFYKALGRPDKPEEYGIKMPEKIGDKAFPKELWDDGLVSAFAKFAHERGFTKEQTQALVEFDAARGLKAHEGVGAAQQKAQADAVAALKTAWGSDYDANLALAKKAAEQAGGADLLAHPLANDPVFIKAMAKVGKMIVEESAAGARGTRTPQQGDPQAQIDAIMNDKNHAWQPDFAKHGHSAAAHDAALKDMTALYRLKNGEAAA